MGRFLGKNRFTRLNRSKYENRRLIESAINRYFEFQKIGILKKIDDFKNRPRGLPRAQAKLQNRLQNKKIG